jgi:hypothetical protein
MDALRVRHESTRESVAPFALVTSSLTSRTISRRALRQASYVWRVNHVWRFLRLGAGRAHGGGVRSRSGSLTWRSCAPRLVEGGPTSGLGDDGEARPP